MRYIYMYLHLHVTFIYAIVLPIYILYRVKSYRYPAARWIASDAQSSSIEVSVHLFSKPVNSAHNTWNTEERYIKLRQIYNKIVVVLPESVSR